MIKQYLLYLSHHPKCVIERVGQDPQTPNRVVVYFKTLSWFSRCRESNKQSKVAAKLSMPHFLYWEEGNLILNKPRFSKILIMCHSSRGVLPGKLGVGVRPASQQTVTLFIAKISDIFYPICDLTKNLKPYLWPPPYIKNPVSDQCLIIVNTICEGLLLISFQ